MNENGKNLDRLRLGVAGLRSGRFVQGDGALEVNAVEWEAGERRVSKEHCCLGVLTRVAIENGLEIPVDESGQTTRFGSGEATAYLPVEVAEWYGLSRFEGDPILRLDEGTVTSTATYLNDGERWSFDEIAKAMERTWEL